MALTAVDFVARTMPHSLEAEKSVLGAMLCFDTARHVAFSALAPTDFFRDAHRRIFTAMLVLSERGVPADYVLVKEELSRTGELDECGGPAYITALSDGVPRSANVQHYAAIVREKARLRALIFSSNATLSDAYAGELTAAVIASELARNVARDLGAAATRPVTAHAAAVEYTTELDAGTVLLPTGLADVDGLLGGIAMSDLTIVAARPSVGKTTLTLGMAQHIAETGQTVAFFTLEMKRSKLAARLMAWRSRVQTTVLERGLASEDEYARVVEAQVALEGLPLHFDEHARTLVEIDAWCRRLRDETGGLAACFIDYLQLIDGDTRHGVSRQEQVAATSRGCKRLAKDLGIAVVALSQLGRAPETRSDKRPHLSDLRESGALEQDADVAALVFRPEMHKKTDENEGIAELIIAKNRTGPVGVTRLFFDSDYAQFRNLAASGI